MGNQAKEFGSRFWLGGVFAVLFTALKLLGEIDWPWWWILAPLWAPVAIFLLIVMVIIVLRAAVS